MTDKQYRRSYRKRHKAYEKAALSFVRAAFENQRKAVLSYLKKEGSGMFYLAIEVLISREELKRAYSLIYASVGMEEGRAEQAIFTSSAERRIKSGPISFSDADWRNYMVNYMLTYAGDRIDGINRKTKEKLRFLLAYAQEQGYTTDQTVNYLIQEIGSEDFVEFSRSRAMAIARTEATTAANVGTLKAGESLSIQYEKRWISTQDDRTRRIPEDKFDHFTMNGKTVAANESFTVSGEQMLHPGDPSKAVSRGNVINCRCVARLVPVYDEQGLPKPKTPVQMFATV